MSNTFISIKSVLYNLSRLIPEHNWNEIDFLEWTTMGLRKTKIPAKYETKVCYMTLEDHKTVLPSDLKYIIQVLYKTNSTASEIEEFKRVVNMDSVEWNPAINHMENVDGLATRAAEATLSRIKWKPMKLSSSSFLSTIVCDPSVLPPMPTSLETYPYNTQCDYEYTVSPTNILTSDLDNALLAISYLRFPKEENGDTLIPDNETLKEALMNYCLWMYFMKRDIIGEVNADKKAVQYKQMFGLMAAKAAAELNEPDIAQLENLKNMTQRLVPRANQFNNMFSKLNNSEKLRY